MPGKFYPLPLVSFQSDLKRQANSRWALPQLLSFFPSRNLRAPWADRLEILHDARCCVRFFNPVQNFEGTSPKKFLGEKNMQNLARFWSTLKFGGEYLRNGWRYSKSVGYFFDSDFSRVNENKSGEFWSGDFWDLLVELYPPKTHFSKNYISAQKGCCAPKFLHALENNQVLLAHSLTVVGPLLQLFLKKV